MNTKNRLMIFTLVLVAVGVIFAVPYFKNDGAEKEKVGTFSVTQQPGAKIDEAIKKGKPVYIEFYGKTCPACREMESVVLPLEQKYGDEIQFVIVDVNTPEGGSLAGQFSVNLIPAMFILDGKGNLVWSEVGVQSHKTLETYLKKAMKAQ